MLMNLFMNESKKLNRVCTLCIEENENLKISSEFKVSVEYGTCDCCGKKGVLVPFGRFFNENTKITPRKVATQPKKDEEYFINVYENSVKSTEAMIAEVKGSIESLKDELGQTVELIRELQDKVGSVEACIEAPLLSGANNYANGVTHADKSKLGTNGKKTVKTQKVSESGSGSAQNVYD